MAAPLPITVEQPVGPPLSRMGSGPPWTLITRQFSNFTHGDPIAALLVRPGGITHVPIGLESTLPPLNRGSTTLVPIDSCVPGAVPQQGSVTRLLQTDQQRRFLQARAKVCAVSDQLRPWMEQREEAVGMRDGEMMQIYVVESRT